MPIVNGDLRRYADRAVLTELARRSTGIDYDSFESGGLAFDYAGLLDVPGMSLTQIAELQRERSRGVAALASRAATVMA